MNKYIDVKDARNLLAARLHQTALNNDGIDYVYEDIVDNRLDTWLNEIPAADVQEVRHGRWIKEYRGNFVCSVCGAWFRTTDEYGNIIDGEMRAKYCEECGAKMDGDEENERDI